MKEAIISTEAVNSYGTRVLTDGIDTAQYERNPIILYMHRRNFDGAGPGVIGRMEGLRKEGGKLYGTPVFDQADEYAKQIESKWEGGFLRMVSAGLEILETTDAPEMVAEGQTRVTVTRSKLVEVSIVDIGSNDEALQLYEAGKLLTLAAGEESPKLPRLKQEKPEPTQSEGEEKNNQQTSTTTMTKEQLALLGLAETATDEQATAALQLMKQRADNADSLQLAAVTTAVDTAVKERRLLADQREQFITLGKAAGLDQLNAVLKTMPVQQKPTETLNLSKESAPGAGGEQPKAYTKLSEVPSGELMELRKEQPAKYAELYRAEYGIDCGELSD